MPKRNNIDEYVKYFSFSLIFSELGVGFSSRSKIRVFGLVIEWACGICIWAKRTRTATANYKICGKRWIEKHIKEQKKNKRQHTPIVWPI